MIPIKSLKNGIHSYQLFTKESNFRIKLAIGIWFPFKQINQTNSKKDMLFAIYYTTVNHPTMVILCWNYAFTIVGNFTKLW